MTITTVLDPPLATDSESTFNTKAFAFVDALVDWTSEANSTATTINTNATNAAASASSATASAAAAAVSQTSAANSASVAAAASGAPLWVSGTTYSVGNCVWSPSSKLIYRRIVGGAGTTDPANDTTNWGLAATGTLQLIDVSGTSVSAHVNGHYRLNNAAQTTVVLPTAGLSVGDVVMVSPNNSRSDNRVDPASNTINLQVGYLFISDPTETVVIQWWGLADGWKVII